jgi:glyoxylase-like metal-dependent hydrolase (beta-lactamase superfamily II)
MVTECVPRLMPPVSDGAEKALSDTPEGDRVGEVDTGPKERVLTPFICLQCGAHFAGAPGPPGSCLICEDERQFVRWGGQAWTTPEELRRSHTVRLEEDAGLMGLGVEPSFAIGQRALLVPFGESNLLWDCIPLLDRAAVESIEALGGLRAIAVSHPHYYTGMVEWSRAFGRIPVFLHRADQAWITLQDPAVRLWEGQELELGEGLTLHRLGGHFPGGTVLHWAGGAEGRGALLTGDILQVVKDRRWVSFMYSYPNLIPLPAETVRRMAELVARLDFWWIHGAWWGHNVLEDARGAVARSARRYVEALEAEPGRPDGPE